MTKRSPEQVYALCRQAGFSPQAAVIMTAIAGAESGYDDANIGDVSLQNATWGPSVGLFQIRTQKNQSGTGGYRDASWLAQSDLNQAKAAYSISGGGANFSPWTVYNTGSYGKFMSGARAAAQSVGDKLQNFLVGPAGGVAAGAVNAATGLATGALDAVLTPLLEGGKQLGFTAAFAAIGGLLVIGGALVFAYPSIKRTTAQAAKAVKAVI